MKNQAFTLVELIVVITILAVLGTLGFMSFQGYAKTSRDTVRVSDLKLIEKALEFEITKNDILPYPDSYITLTASGTILGYQGYAGEVALGKIGITNKITDPSDETEYTYSTNTSRTKYQLLGFGEAELSNTPFTQSYADFSKRIAYLKGNELGILVDDVTHVPIQDVGADVDVQNTIFNYGLFVNNGENKISGTGGVLVSEILPNKISGDYNSCKDIYENNDITHGVDGIYKINVDNLPVTVYCDMTYDGGGWTSFYGLIKDDVKSFSLAQVPGKINLGNIGGDVWSSNIEGIKFNDFYIKGITTSGDVNGKKYPLQTQGQVFSGGKIYGIDSSASGDVTCSFQMRFRTHYSTTDWEVGVNRNGNSAMDAACRHGVGVNTGGSSVMLFRSIQNNKIIFFIR